MHDTNDMILNEQENNEEAREKLQNKQKNMVCWHCCHPLKQKGSDYLDHTIQLKNYTMSTVGFVQPIVAKHMY